MSRDFVSTCGRLHQRWPTASGLIMLMIARVSEVNNINSMPRETLPSHPAPWSRDPSRRGGSGRVRGSPNLTSRSASAVCCQTNDARPRSGPLSRREGTMAPRARLESSLHADLSCLLSRLRSTLSLTPSADFVLTWGPGSRWPLIDVVVSRSTPSRQQSSPDHATHANET